MIIASAPSQSNNVIARRRCLESKTINVIIFRYLKSRLVVGKSKINHLTVYMRPLSETDIPCATKQSQILICARKYLFASKLSNEVTFSQTFLSKQPASLREDCLPTTKWYMTREFWKPQYRLQSGNLFAAPEISRKHFHGGVSRPLGSRETSFDNRIHYRNQAARWFKEQKWIAPVIYQIHLRMHEVIHKLCGNIMNDGLGPLSLRALPPVNSRVN